MVFKINDKMKGKKKKWMRKYIHNPSNVDCQHCKYKEREESVPKQSYKFPTHNSSGAVTGEHTVNEITIVYGSDDDVIGWVSK